MLSIRYTRPIYINDIKTMNIKICAILVLSLTLSACAKKSEESSSVDSQSAEVEQAASPDQHAAMEAAEAADAAEANATPVSAQKPDVILSQQVSQAEATRRMVREANIQFTVKDVVKATLEIEKLTLQAGGFIEEKNIDFTVRDTDQQKIADGKIKIFEKVEPQASMIIRVPSQQAAQVVNQLLPLMHFLNQQLYSAKRFELKLLEEKIAQTQSVPSDTRSSQLNEISRLTQMEVNDRVRYSTIQLSILQPALVRERIDVDIDAVARLNGDSFWKRAWNGIQYGWQFVLDLLVILITIWPLYLIGLISFLLYRLIKPWLSKLK